MKPSPTSPTIAAAIAAAAIAASLALSPAKLALSPAIAPPSHLVAPLAYELAGRGMENDAHESLAVEQWQAAHPVKNFLWKITH